MQNLIWLIYFPLHIYVVSTSFIKILFIIALQNHISSIYIKLILWYIWTNFMETISHFWISYQLSKNMLIWPYYFNFVIIDKCQTVIHCRKTCKAIKINFYNKLINSPDCKFSILLHNSTSLVHTYNIFTK